MERLVKLHRSIKRVSVVQKDVHGGTAAVTVYKKNNRKKQHSLLKPFERVARRVAKATAAGAQTYTDRHEKSNSKKRNGWIRQLPKNVRRARKAFKKKL